MSKTLQIRNVPEKVHRALQTRAAASGLSLSEYLLKELTRVAARSDVAEALERSANLAPGLTTGAIVAAVRRSREEREGGLYTSVARRQSRVAER